MGSSGYLAEYDNLLVEWSRRATVHDCVCLCLMVGSIETCLAFLVVFIMQAVMPGDPSILRGTLDGVLFASANVLLGLGLWNLTGQAVKCHWHPACRKIVMKPSVIVLRKGNGLWYVDLEEVRRSEASPAASSKSSE